MAVSQSENATLQNKRSGLRAIGLFVAIAAVVLSGLIMPRSASALVIDGYGGSGIRNLADARAWLSSYCTNNNVPTGVAAFPTNIRFDDATGYMLYDANIVWRSCGKVDSTRAFAVIGYPSSSTGQPATCPDVGTYGFPDSPTYQSTYDCVKYTGSDAGHLNGYATLGCYRNTVHGYGCTNGNFGLIERNSLQPDNTYNGNTNTLSNLSGQVPDWGTRTLTSGSWDFYRGDAFCSYYKYNSNGAGAWGNCMSLTIKVSWTRYDFNLEPSISVSPNVVTPGSSIQPSPSVNNTGTTASSSVKWQVSRFTVAPGGSVPGADINGNTPENHYGNGAVKVVDGDRTFNKGVVPLSVDSQVVGDLAVGTKLCYTLSVQPYRHDSANWNHGTPACAVVAKSPKVQVLAGDLLVGRASATNPSSTSRIITSVTNKGSAYYGSWAEYAIVPTGCVTGMASGSGYVGGPSISSLNSNLSILTFTRQGGTGCPTGIGGYTQTTIAPNVSARFPINVPAAAASGSKPADPAVLPNATVNLVSNDLSGSYQAPAGATNIQITGGDPIPASRWVVINAPAATVTITGNIRYTNSPLTAMSQIPQVVIIAKNIIIADNVDQIDAWLVAVGNGADGVVNTCGAGAVTPTSDLTYQQCDRILKVNGPVIANKLVLRRTAGSGTGAESGAPAEIFNLRADAYIWATAYNLTTGRLSTVDTKELPPRF